MDGLQPTGAPPLATVEPETEPESQAGATTTIPAAAESPRALDLDPALMQEEHKILGAPTTDKHEPTAVPTPDRSTEPRDPDRPAAGATLRQGDAASSTRPQLTIDTGLKSDRAIRNAVAGGLMSSPSSMIPAAYVAQLYSTSPYSTSPNNSSFGKVGQSSTAIKRRSSRRGSVSGLVGRTGLVPAKATTAQRSGTTALATAVRETSSTISRPDIDPPLHALKDKLTVQPLRSVSYSGTSAASRSTDPPQSNGAMRPSEWHADGPSNPQTPHLQHHHHFPGLQKSKSFGIHSKKVFASQLRKLRQRRGSRESTSGISSAGESDAEPMCEGQPNGRAGHLQKTTASMHTSKANGHPEDSTLPPPPRMRANSRPERRDSVPSSIPAYAIPYGFGSMGSAPLSASTKSPASSGPSSGSPHNSTALSHGDPAKELSFATGRFRDMLKRNVVGLAGPGSSSGLYSPLSATALPQLDHSGGRRGSSQSSSAIADMMFGDEQPSLFSISRIAGRRSKFNSKPYGEESADGSPPGSEDDDTPLTIRQATPNDQKQPGAPHLHRHRSRGAGQISDQTRVKVKPISHALREARQSNPDPNVLYAEVQPLPGAFMEAFGSHAGSPATVSSPMARPPLTPTAAPSAPLTTSMTAAVSKQMLLAAFPMTVGMLPSTSAMRTRTDSIPDSALSNPTTASTVNPRLQYSHRAANRMSAGDPLGSRNFLFKSYLNSKFQGHYVFRVRDDQVEYGRLPVSLEQACSLYFREADVTYRSLEKKAKLWREEQRNAQARREQARQIARDNIQSVPGNNEDYSGSAPGMASEKDARCEGSANIGMSKDTVAILKPTHSNSLQGREPLERHQRAMDEAYWQEVERAHWQESKEAIYGLERCLWELVKSVEYERFDFINQIEILNENRETALFSIVNGDKTNVMWLESPSVKLKQEFLNWIAVSLMDHGDSDLCAEKVSEIRRRGAEVNKFLKGDGGLEKRVPDQEAVDYILSMAEIRIHLLEADIRSKREDTMSTMKGLEAVLDKLDNLDEETKTLMTRMTRAIDSGEVQAALQPSLSTGMTLAETVHCKIRDVNERIIVCARIMGAARLNLNRLKYEIELEQRSMRLIRRYKIVIGIATLSVLLLVWLLYRRSSHFAAAVLGDGSTTEPLSSSSSYFAAHVPETTSPYFSNPVRNPFLEPLSTHPQQPPHHPLHPLHCHHHHHFGKQSDKSDPRMSPDKDDTAVELEEEDWRVAQAV